MISGVQQLCREPAGCTLGDYNDIGHEPVRLGAERADQSSLQNPRQQEDNQRCSSRL